MIRHALSIVFLLSIAPCCAGITTKMLNLGGGTLQSAGAINAENGHVTAGQGYLRNVKIENDLLLEVKQKLLFSDSSIGKILTINGGTVELKRIAASHLIVQGNAIVYIDGTTCVIGQITKDETASVLPAGEAASDSASSENAAPSED